MSNGTHKRLVLVIGGTGAQGFSVIEALLAASFSIRVLSRDPSAPYVKKTFAKYPEVEFAQGSFMDFEAVRKALEGCYGVYVNTDGEFGYTVCYLRTTAEDYAWQRNSADSLSQASL